MLIVILLTVVIALTIWYACHEVTKQDILDKQMEQRLQYSYMEDEIKISKL